MFGITFCPPLVACRCHAAGIYIAGTVMTLFFPDSPPRFINLVATPVVEAVVDALYDHGFHPERIR